MARGISPKAMPPVNGVSPMETPPRERHLILNGSPLRTTFEYHSNDDDSPDLTESDSNTTIEVGTFFHAIINNIIF